MIIKVGKSICPTDVGKQLINIIEEPMLTSVETTGKWERQLREIEKGNYTDEQFINSITVQVREIIDRVKGDRSGRLITFPTPSSPPSTHRCSSRKGSRSGRSSYSKKR